MGRGAMGLGEDLRVSRNELATRARQAARAVARKTSGVAPLDPNLEFGATPKDLIFSRDTQRLFRYRPVCDEIYRVPVLLVMSLVSRPYILDLAKGQSLVEFLIGKGFDVYLLDWGIPRPEHAKNDFGTYVLDLLPECVKQVGGQSGEPDVSVIAYCLGGTLACMYAALHPHGPLKNLVCFTTPVNSDGMQLQRTWTDPEHFDIDRLVDELGNIPPDLVMASMQMLRPLQKRAGQMKLLDHASDDAFVKAHLRFERWAADQVPFPGEVARQMTKDFLIGNQLVKGAFRIRDQPVDLGRIRVPFLHAAAVYDHLVPTEASRDLVRLVGSEDKAELVLKGGHVSLVAGGNAVYRLWPQLDAWLAQRSL